MLVAAGEYFIAGSAETCEKRVVNLARRKSGLFPSLLQSLRLIGSLFPFGIARAFARSYGLGLLAQLGLYSLRFLFRSLTGLEEILMATEYDGCRLIELFPYLITDFLGYRPYLTPLLPEILKLAKSGHDILFRRKILHFLDKESFLLQILLEVEIAEFLVHLQAVVELLNGCLEILPHFVFLALRNLLDEVGLKLLEFRKAEVYVVDVLSEVYDFLYDVALVLKVGKTTGLLCGHILRTAFAESLRQIGELLVPFVRRGREVLRVVSGFDELGKLTLSILFLEVAISLAHAIHFPIGIKTANGKYFPESIDKFFSVHRMERFEITVA